MALSDCGGLLNWIYSSMFIVSAFVNFVGAFTKKICFTQWDIYKVLGILDIMNLAIILVIIWMIVEEDTGNKIIMYYD